MKTEKGCSRRQFLKTAGAAGVVSLLAGKTAASPMAMPSMAQKAGDALVPTRPFGRSGRQVSILSLGGMFDIGANQLMLRQAIKWGVTYWDTADCYEGGGSEKGFGKYFAKYPEDRQKIFLVTKSDSRDPSGMTRLLDQSLERLNTDYIDLYFIHGMRSMSELNDSIRQWAAKAKAENRIRLFGFSTHRNMEELLAGAAKLDWIDGIMLKYNFRIMNSPEMKSAVAACINAGIGLTAMKTQAGSSWSDWSSNTKEGKALADAFKEKGWTEEQAKLKAVWSNPQIASICSQMDSMRLLKANTDAAVDPTPISTGELRLLERYAVATASHHCIGCGQCEAVTASQVPVSDIMRYHMYNRTYGRSDWARSQFEVLSEGTRNALATADFSTAERLCPQKMPIGRLMREALADFT